MKERKTRGLPSPCSSTIWLPSSSSVVWKRLWLRRGELGAAAVDSVITTGGLVVVVG